MHNRNSRQQQQQPEPLNNLNAHGTRHSRIVAGSNNFNPLSGGSGSGSGGNAASADSAAAYRISRHSVLQANTTSYQTQLSQSPQPFPWQATYERRHSHYVARSGRARADTPVGLAPMPVPAPAPPPAAAPASVDSTMAKASGPEIKDIAEGPRPKDIVRKYPLWLPEYKRKAFNVSKPPSNRHVRQGFKPRLALRNLKLNSLRENSD